MSTDDPLGRMTLRSLVGEDSVELCRHGGQVLTWRGADGWDRLFLSRAAVFAAGKAIRGGVPVIFPQFGAGPLPKHGFARDRAWELADSAADRVLLRLQDSAATRALWPHLFRLELAVSVAPDTLRLAVRVANRGAESFTFTFALHTYFKVAEISLTQLHGLEGVVFRDDLAGGARYPETRKIITVAAEVDRVYENAPEELRITDAGHGREFLVGRRNLPDAVLWNPWSGKARRLPDFLREEYRRMLCVETGSIATPVSLAAGAAWAAETVITVRPA